MFQRHRHYRERLQQPILVCFYFLTRCNHLAVAVAVATVKELHRMAVLVEAAVAELHLTVAVEQLKAVMVGLVEVAAVRVLRGQHLLIPQVMVGLVVVVVVAGIKHLVPLVGLVVVVVVASKLIMQVVTEETVAVAVAAALINLVVLGEMDLLHLLGRRAIK
jgi:hypothetical protein